MSDLIFSKTSNIKNSIRRIKEKTGMKPESLDNDFDVQDVYILNLQRAIQATIDISNIIIKEYNLDLPANYKNGFEILKKFNFIDNDIKEKMIKMAGFRNIAVHNYEKLNLDILKSILVNNIDDFEVFYTQVLTNIGSI